MLAPHYVKPPMQRTKHKNQTANISNFEWKAAIKHNRFFQTEAANSLTVLQLVWLDGVQQVQLTSSFSAFFNWDSKVDTVETKKKYNEKSSEKV